MIELLEPFSRQMAEDLFSAFPTWKDHLSIVTDEGDRHFSIHVPPPAASKNGPIEIYSSANQEVTVCYAGTHAHFFSVLGNVQEARGAIEFLRDILDEQRVVVSYIWEGDATMPNGFVSTGSVPANKIPRANYEYFYTTSIRVRSWKGTYDADFAAPYIKDRPTGSGEHAPGQQEN
ncbi:MAG: hypothetical protein V4801_26805 [Burkholderia gladioli]